jgi:hypothetical protein
MFYFHFGNIPLWIALATVEREMQGYVLGCVKDYSVAHYIRGVWLQINIYPCVRSSRSYRVLPTPKHITKPFVATTASASFRLVWEQWSGRTVTCS